MLSGGRGPCFFFQDATFYLQALLVISLSCPCFAGCHVCSFLCISVVRVLLFSDRTRGLKCLFVGNLFSFVLWLGGAGSCVFCVLLGDLAVTEVFSN